MISNILQFSRCWRTGLGEFTITPDKTLGLPIFSFVGPNGEFYGSNVYHFKNAHDEHARLGLYMFDQTPVVSYDDNGRVNVFFKKGHNILSIRMQIIPRHADVASVTMLLARIKLLENKVAALETAARKAPEQPAPPAYSEEKE